VRVASSSVADITMPKEPLAMTRLSVPGVPVGRWMTARSMRSAVSWSRSSDNEASVTGSSTLGAVSR